MNSENIQQINQWQKLVAAIKKLQIYFCTTCESLTAPLFQLGFIFTEHVMNSL